MRVALDVGPVKAQPAGVGIYARSLAVAMADLLPEGELAFIGKRSDAAGLPQHIRTRTRAGKLPYPAWAELLAGVDARRVGAEVAHFTDGLVPVARAGPSVVTVHDLSIVRHWRSHQLHRLPRIPLVLAAPHLATRVIADSRATADELIRLAHVSARKIDVVMLGPRSGAAPATPEAIATAMDAYRLVRHRYVLAPGTLEPRKNHLRLIHAFEDLVRRSEIDADISLVVAGGQGWGSAPVVAAIDESPCASRIRRLGYVPDEDLAALMTGAGLVAYVSTYEGFGLPILEAMACGAPVVTSAVSSMPEAAGDAALLVDPYRIESIARGLVGGLAGREHLAEASVTHARMFSWAKTAFETLGIYTSAVR
jgi:glycosyltransferase involved in cell wall biosynthesis